MWYQLLILVPNLYFGTNCAFWYQMFVLVTACCFHTACLFWYQFYVLVLTNSRCPHAIAWMNKNMVELVTNDGAALCLKMLAPMREHSYTQE